MLIARIFNIANRSGVNVYKKINTHHVASMDELIESELKKRQKDASSNSKEAASSSSNSKEASLSLNSLGKEQKMAKGIFKNFWKLQKYMINFPLLLDSSSEVQFESNEENFQSAPAENGNKKPHHANDTGKNSSELTRTIGKIESVLTQIQSILQYFSMNPINPSQKAFERFPKNLAQIELIHDQLDEPFFRKVFLFQCRIFLLTISSPSKLPKPFPALPDRLTKQIGSLVRNVNRQLSKFSLASTPGVTLDQITESMVENEQHWVHWKDEQNCCDFELGPHKPVSVETLEEHFGQPAMKKKREIIEKSVGMKKVDQEYFRDMLNADLFEYPNETSEDTFGLHILPLLEEIKNGKSEGDSLIDEIEGNPVSSWRLQRVAARDQLALFNRQTSIGALARKIAGDYGLISPASNSNGAAVEKEKSSENNRERASAGINESSHEPGSVKAAVSG